MKQSYDVLNEYLNFFWQQFDSPIFHDHLNDFLELSNRTLAMFRNKRFYVPASKEIHSMTLDESLDLCNEFIQTYLEPYYDQWKEFLHNGVVDFTDLQQMAIDGEPRKGSEAKVFRKKNQAFREINVELEHNYIDPSIIIHEFVHQLNVNIPENLGENDGFITFSRVLFTESVSIYFETLLFRFMEEKGFDKEEIAKAQVARIYDLFRTVEPSLDHLILLRDYEIFGKISDDNVDNAKEYHLLTFDRKEDYQRVAHGIENRIIQRQEDLNHMQLSYDFFNPLGYTVGTVLTYWAISQNDSNMPWKFVQFNEDLARDRDLGYAFSRFSLEPVSIQKLVDGAEKEIDRCIHQISIPDTKRR